MAQHLKLNVQQEPINPTLVKPLVLMLMQVTMLALPEQPPKQLVQRELTNQALVKPHVLMPHLDFMFQQTVQYHKLLV